MAVADHQTQGYRGIQMATRHMAYRKGHGDYGEPECQRDPEEAYAHMGKGGGKDRAPASAENQRHV